MTKKPEPPKLKKVKIDEHLKASKGNNSKAAPRKPGRPRKNPEPLRDSGIPITGGDPSFSAPHSAPIEEHIRDSEQPSVEPVFDTTEEAKLFLRTPFDMAAGLAGIPKLALYPAQLDALAPSFKPIYDKYVVPYLGENAAIVIFCVGLSGVVAEKVAIFNAEMELRKPIKAQPQTDSVGMPSIPMEHHA